MTTRGEPRPPRAGTARRGSIPVPARAPAPAAPRNPRRVTGCESHSPASSRPHPVCRAARETAWARLIAAEAPDNPQVRNPGSLRHRRTLGQTLNRPAQAGKSGRSPVPTRRSGRPPPRRGVAGSPPATSVGARMGGVNQEQLTKVKAGRGFFAALDQSGGSTPKALAEYGIARDRYSSEAEMFDLVHAMRTRVLTSPAFDGSRVLAAILFEQTMDRDVDGLPTAR